VAASVTDAAYEAAGAEITDAPGPWAASWCSRCAAHRRRTGLMKSGATLVGMLNPFDAPGLQRLAAAG
jgi:NAD(P) transhydrogenase subunit alpha